MAKPKLTRKSYKRNILVFGIMLFMGIALVSTGFATWVLSQNTTVEAGGNVEVGIVSDNALKISDLKFYSKYDPNNLEDETKTKLLDEKELNFYFEPTEDDTTGNVKNDGKNFEQLTLYIVGKVAPMAFVDDFNITMTFNLPDQIQAAVDAKYIQLPACAAPNGVNIVEKGEITDSASIKEDGTFVIEVSFEWGEYFNYMNPGKYYDETEAGKAVKFSEMKTALQNFRGSIHGCTYVDFEGDEYAIYKINNVDYIMLTQKDNSGNITDIKYHKVTKYRIDENNKVVELEWDNNDSEVTPVVPEFQILITVTSK